MLFKDKPSGNIIWKGGKGSPPPPISVTYTKSQYQLSLKTIPEHPNHHINKTQK